MPAARFGGVYPILYCYFDRAGGIDHAAMRLQTERCIAEGAHGIAILGNVTESNKLTQGERLELMASVGEAIAGRVPYAVTVGEPSIGGQLAMVRAAAAAGADWVILQPPPVKGVPERELVRFFGAVADASPLPVAIQNNPVNMDIWLTNASLIELHQNHPNVTLLKAEGPSTVVQQLIEATDGALDVFAGRGGLEFITNLASGCAGLIPAPDCVAVQVRIFELWQDGTPAARAEAERLHRQTLPLTVFMSQSLAAHQLAIGKRSCARWLGLGEVHDRPPAVAPSAFGLDEAWRLAGTANHGRLAAPPA